MKTILATFDVVDLYTNIPHAYGLEALYYQIDNHPGSLHERFNKEFVLESVTLILENNNCKLNDDFFVEINGTVIGTTSVPIHVTLSMVYFELTFYRICINEFSETLDQFILENWCWFLQSRTKKLAQGKEIQ